MKPIEIKFFKLAIHPLFLILAVIMIALGYIEQFFILFIITTIHEFSHIIIAKMCGVGLVRIIIYPIGEMAVLENLYLTKPLNRIFIICAGPAMNILLGVIFMHLWNNDILKFIAIANFSIGLFNSLPIYPLDGGKLLYVLLGNMIGILNANDVIICISKIFILIMMVLGVVQVVLYPYNVSLICISVYLGNIIKSEEFNLSLEFFRNIFSKTEFISKYGYMHTHIITVSEDICIKDILKHLKSDSFCRIHIVDKELNLISYIDENQLMGFIVQYGIKANIKETIKI